MNPIAILRTFAGARKLAVASGLTAVLLLLFSQAALSAVVTRFEAEGMSESSSSIAVFRDSNASGGEALRYTGRATAEKVVDFSAPTGGLEVRARGIKHNGEWPSVRVFVDGTIVGVHDVATKRVASSSYATYAFPVDVAAGQHTVYVEALSGVNAKRSLAVDSVAFTGDEPDLDGDGVPDGADPDLDGDGFANGVDLNPRLADPNQPDLDGDKIGDAFDATDDRPDGDADGVKDVLDNCPRASNLDQKDLDQDGAGDVCDADRDGDGVENARDNCPNQANLDQKDSDGDGVGDACDSTARPACTVTIRQGEDLDAKMETTDNGRHDVYCVEAGTYPLSRTVTLYGDELIGEAGTKTQRGAAVDPNPVVHITNTVGLPRLFTATGKATMKWLDVTGAEGKYVEPWSPGDPCINPSEDGLRCPKNGTGINMGVPGGSDVLLEHMRIADSDAVGISMVGTARIFRSEFVNNSRNLDFHGFSAGAVKGVAEFEAGYNYVHDNLANGLWADHGTTHVPARNDASGVHKGAWFHHNLVLNNGRWGMRYEYSARLEGNQLSDNAHFAAENNQVHGNRLGGVSMHDAQNGTINDNVFGAVNGYPGNGNGLAILFADSNGKLYGQNDPANPGRTDLYNAKATNNKPNGERITNCDKPDQIVYCASNTP